VLVVEEQPEVVLVKVNVTAPAVTPVTIPAFVTVAIAVLLLAHVPPVVGLSFVVEPTQTVLYPIIDTTGFALIVIADVGKEIHPVEFVNVNVVLPAATPVTTPPLVTVAIAVLLLVHVPPVLGLNVLVDPTQIEVPPVIDTTGFALTVIEPDVSEHVVVVLVNVNVALPAATPVTTPPFVIVAIAVLLLVHVPPVVGLKVVVAATHIEALPVMDTTGFALIVIVGVGFDAHPVEFVNVNVAFPAVTPVTTPAFVTVAIAELLLAHVPPVLGLNVLVDATQIEVPPVIDTTGFAAIEIADDGSEVHPVAVLVNVNVALPAANPVTTPPFVTVATDALLLVHVPPVVGLNVVVDPMHMLFAPVIVTAGFAFIVTLPVALDTHPVAVLVNVNVALPAATPVTTPAFVTVATDALLLVHVPPVVGLNVVVDPMHMLFAPVIVTAGFAFIVTLPVALDAHPVAVLVNINVALPAANPVTTPAFVTVAIDGLLLVHVPPVVGLNTVVDPIHIELLPLIDTTGIAFTVIGAVGVGVQPAEFVKVK
jgi:hypothetical protein